MGSCGAVSRWMQPCFFLSCTNPLRPIGLTELCGLFFFYYTNALTLQGCGIFWASGHQFFFFYHPCLPVPITFDSADCIMNGDILRTYYRAFIFVWGQGVEVNSCFVFIFFEFSNINYFTLILMTF